MWIPDAGETEALEIFAVGGGELGDAVVTEGAREAGVVDAAASDAGRGGMGPDFGHEAAGIVHEFPARVFTQGLDKLYGRVGGKWVGQHSRVAQQAVEFHEDEFTQDKIGGGRLGFEPRAGSGVPRMS